MADHARTAHPTAAHPTAAGSGFAVRDDALAAYVEAARALATDLAGCAGRELSTARELPADAFGRLAHTTGFTAALVRFCGHATDTAHALAETMRHIESTMDETLRNYRATERAVAEHIAAQHHAAHAHHGHAAHHTNHSTSGGAAVTA
jgi:hypothetical protein